MESKHQLWPLLGPTDILCTLCTRMQDKSVNKILKFYRTLDMSHRLINFDNVEYSKDHFTWGTDSSKTSGNAISLDIFCAASSFSPSTKQFKPFPKMRVTLLNGAQTG